MLSPKVELLLVLSLPIGSEVCAGGSCMLNKIYMKLRCIFLSVSTEDIPDDLTEPAKVLSKAKVKELVWLLHVTALEDFPVDTFLVSIYNTRNYNL